MEEKKALRKKMAKMRLELPPEEKAAFDRSICRQLLELVEKRQARTIHTYLPMGAEVDIYPAIENMLARGLTVVAPKSLAGRRMQQLVLHSLDELEAGIFGTRHPLNRVEYTGSYDLVIVPGLAFDRRGRRLGYGAGYYDYFLKDHPEAYKVGVCYPFQLVEALPVEAHDVGLDGVVV